jgi:hypothetical protein
MMKGAEEVHLEEKSKLVIIQKIIVLHTLKFTADYRQIRRSGTAAGYFVPHR